MKKIAVFLLCTLMLWGCDTKNSGMDQALSFRQNLLSCDQCQLRVAITADYGDMIHTFSMDCEFDKDGTMSFCVIEPASISGITGKVYAKGGELTFDDKTLAFPLLADGYICPVSAPWVFMKALRSGYVDSCGTVDEGFYMLLNDSYEENPIQIDVYSNIDFIPIQAEMVWKGRRVLSIDVSNFSCV